MRRGEILGLRWSDIDLKTARLTVNQSLQRLAGKTVFKPPKTAGSRRTITLPALTVDALAQHRAEQGEDWPGRASLQPRRRLTDGPGQHHEGV
jgi:integrase